MKPCSNCGGPNLNTRGVCHSCHAAQQRTRRRKNPEKFRQWDRRKRERELAKKDPTSIRNRKFRQWNKHLKRTYRIDFEGWARMFNTQSGKCAGCGDNLGSNDVRIHVDHNHYTGDVRGLLCQGCNNALGGARDNPKTLIALARYVLKAVGL